MQDEGHPPAPQYFWQPMGNFTVATNIDNTNVNFGPGVTSADKVYRIDYASLIIDYQLVDGECEADMYINTLAGYEAPFLSVSARPFADTASDVLVPQHRWEVQLSLPFYIVGNWGIFVRGFSSSLIGISTIWATLSASQAWSPVA
jgi:hypothetical protein